MCLSETPRDKKKKKTSWCPLGCDLYLIVQSCYFLLTCCGEQEGVHLGLQRVIHLHVNVIASSLLLVIRVHATKQFNVFRFSSQWMRHVRDLFMLHCNEVT